MQLGQSLKGPVDSTQSSTARPPLKADLAGEPQVTHSHDGDTLILTIVLSSPCEEEKPQDEWDDAHPIFFDSWWWQCSQS